MTDSQELVLSEIRNRVGHITLNRPAAYNATNLDMVCTVLEQLRAWETEDEVLAVVLRATGEGSEQFAERLKAAGLEVIDVR